MECIECGKEVETRIEDGKFVSGCWSASHEPPMVEGLEDSADDIWPRCGLPSDSVQASIDSYLKFAEQNNNGI